MKFTCSTPVIAGALFLCGATIPAPAQLLQNLQAFGNSVSLIDPAVPPSSEFESDGPKELVTADFDLDGKPDLAASKVFGKVTAVFGLGGKDFAEPVFLSPPAGTGELRGITAGDFNGDGRPDIAVAAPFSGRIVIFTAAAGRTFAAPVTVTAWPGVRNLIGADLNGDGRTDVLGAGPLDNSSFSDRAQAVAYYNTAGGSFTTGPALDLTGGTAWRDAFPRPVFTMAAVPPAAGTTAQRIVVTHALSDSLWLLGPLSAADPALSIHATYQALIPTQSIVTGRVLTQAGSPDLIAAARDDNQLLLRSGTASGFAPEIAQRLYLPGAPRALAVADVDNDGWNDLLVVLRNYDRVVTFHNDAGTLRLSAEAPVGSSPRDLAVADFNNDGRADLAVANRKSDDLSILLTQSSGAGFERLDSVYPADAGVSGLYLRDLDNDGRADVIQTHMLTSEISVRLSQTGGALGPSIFTRLTGRPLSLRPGDFNDDGRIDLVVVHNDEWAPGLSVLLGTGDGKFQTPQFLPADGGLFSVLLTDFDGDGVQDAAVGYYDCRLSMYKGMPGGTFSLRRTGLFTYEARAMVGGDFDQDGDLDLAGASAMGTMTVVNNDGHLLEVPALGTPHDRIYTKVSFTGSGDKSGIKSMVTLDYNGDSEPDLAINSEEGVTVFTGGPGLMFTAVNATIPGTRGATDLLRGDFDGDGTADLATACRLLSCVAILKGLPDLTYQVAAVASVPAADFIAAGDIDGDGLTDLAGGGQVLWTALSSRTPQSATGAAPGARPPIDNVVINELIASNISIPIDGVTGTPDTIELYNGKATAVSLAGWRLRYQETEVGNGNPPPPVTHQFNPVTMLPGARLLLICDDSDQPGHTSFKLAKGGATLTLFSPTAEADSVRYLAQTEDVSLGRFTDGADVWVTKDPPDLGRPNYFDGIGEPRFRQVTVDLATLSAGQPPRFLVKATDDVGIFTMNAVWKWLNPPAGTPPAQLSGQVGLYDDGMHDDGGPLDGLYAARFGFPLPAGAKLEFFLKATNLLDREEISPDDPIFSLPGQPVTNYAFTVPDGSPLSTVEVSEVQTHSAILDDFGVASDFIEIRNTGPVAAPLAGLALRDGLFSSVRTLNLTGTLAPGAHRIYYADDDPEQGPLHLPFKLSNEGDSVWLVKTDSQGIPTLVEKIEPPAREGIRDSWSRLGSGGPFVLLPPTPGIPNVPAGMLHGEMLTPSTPGASRTFRLAMSTATAKIIESWTPGPGAAWQGIGQLSGSPFESLMDVPVPAGRQSQFFRAR